ncbi:MAG: SDR family NAD(P)-dependent oxidoreductase [Pirellulales bacterium]|nr:SDR family NAD(P)-dependent oxidoreductase [Pirellulales bacterium]
MVKSGLYASTKRKSSADYWRQQRVLIAGGTSGFGLVLAKLLSRLGASVMVIGRSAERVRNAMVQCDAEADNAGHSKNRVQGITADLSQNGEGNRVAAHCIDKLGGCDSFFFCIGQSSRSLVLKLTPQEIRSSLDANLMTAIEITQAVAESVCHAHGHLVFIGSLAGKFVTPAMGNYAIGKSALAAFAEAVRLETQPHGGHVLLVCPGPIQRVSVEGSSDPSHNRYDEQVLNYGLPNSTAQPGGGASVRLLDAEKLADEVLAACQQNHQELVRPKKAMFLAGLIEWFPSWGRTILNRYTRRKD